MRAAHPPAPQLVAAAAAADAVGNRARPTFYGWTVLAGLSAAQVISWGVIYYGFALFMDPMARELGWSQAQIAGAFSAAILASALAAIPIGRFMDRRGARGVLLAGACSSVLLFIGWSRVETLTTFYAIWIGMGLAMAAVLYEPAFAIVVAWFIRRRALALTILTSVGGLASAIFVPAIAALIIARGWRTTLLLLAWLLAMVVVPLYALVVRSRPGDVGLQPDGDDGGPAREVRVSNLGVSAPIVRDASGVAWALALTFGLSSLCSAAVAVHVLPFLQARGYSMQAAAWGLAAAGGAQVPARLAFGAIAKVLPTRWLPSSIFVVQAIGFVCLSWAPRSAMFVGLFAASYGFANGLNTLVRSNLVAERFDLTRYGSISGTIAFCGQLARAAGPIAVAWLATTWPYERVWWLLASALCLGAVTMRLLEPHAQAPAREEVEWTR